MTPTFTTEDGALRVQVISLDTGEHFAVTEPHGYLVGRYPTVEALARMAPIGQLKEVTE